MLGVFPSPCGHVSVLESLSARNGAVFLGKFCPGDLGAFLAEFARLLLVLNTSFLKTRTAPFLSDWGREAS